MSVLEVARKKLTEMRARRNGRHYASAVQIQIREESEVSEETPFRPRVNGVPNTAPECEVSEESEESRQRFPFTCDPSVPNPEVAQTLTGARRDDLPYRLLTDPVAKGESDEGLDLAQPIVVEGVLTVIRHRARGQFPAVVGLQVREARRIGKAT